MQLIEDDIGWNSVVVLQPELGPLTDEQFLALCEKYPDRRIESTAEGDLILMPPAHPRTGHRNAILTHQLVEWAKNDDRGVPFDSSCGFFLANGARRSADAAWVSRDRLSGLQDDAALWHVTPEFVIELKSSSDRLRVLREKMKEWIANGVSLGWLLNPEDRSVEVYRADGSVERFESPGEIRGEGAVAGFVLVLDRIWSGWSR